MMNKIIGVMAVLFLILPGPAKAADWQAEKLAAQNIAKMEKGCEVELDTYCKTVAPGGGRRLACIFSHSDKLSSPCESALYGSAKQLQDVAKSLNWFVVACLSDIEKFCAQSGITESSILKCLELNKENVSPHCNEIRQQVTGDKNIDF